MEVDSSREANIRQEARQRNVERADADRAQRLAQSREDDASRRQEETQAREERGRRVDREA